MSEATSISEVKCLACGHVDDVLGVTDWTKEILVCSECRARMVYGKLADRIVIEPSHRDGHLVLLMRIQDPVTKADIRIVELDRQHAGLLAMNLLPMVLP